MRLRRLPQPAAIDKATGVTARVCADCTHHQGDQATKRVQRAESHERILHERMDACRASEAKARSAVSLAAKNADEAHDRIKAALRSRSNLAARIVEAAGESPNHRCPVMDIASDPYVMQWARRAQTPEQVDDDLYP